MRFVLVVPPDAYEGVASAKVVHVPLLEVEIQQEGGLLQTVRPVLWAEQMSGAVATQEGLDGSRTLRVFLAQEERYGVEEADGR